MRDLDFVFEEYPWQSALDNWEQGSNISGAELLTLLEDADEAQVQDALQGLIEKHITLDVSDLPKLSASGTVQTRLSLEEKLVRQGSLPQGLEKNDPLRLYLEELAQMPEGEKTPTDKMLPLAVECACGFAGNGVLLLDLIQEASLGLLQAIDCYSQGDFESHCKWWMEQYLAGAVLLQAKESGVGQKLRQAAEDYRQTDERLLAELGRNPTVEEIAEAMHITVQEAGTVAETLENVLRMKRVKTPEPEQLPQEEDQAVEDTAYFQMRQRIAELLSGLPEEDAKLLQLRYGLEGGLPMKPGEVAVRLGLTEDAVNKREAAALAKLRQQ